jgi:5-methylcytosine-specific restriction endonuclease McrBC GTP-binding regulatory subunit McrB
LPGKNVIYYGAPGTGKTYNLLELVKNKVKAQLQDETDKEEKYYKVVQFHPSYGYEDFIDGIKPSKIDSNGNLNFQLVNGEFKKMCIDAAEELKNADNPKNFYFIADEINRAELSRAFGELLLCLEEDKRLKYNKEEKKWSGVKVKTQNSPLWGSEHAVIEIENDKFFGVPENLYFLGTMNDIDRSIDSFDLALRRRFVWVHKGCDYDVIYDDLVKKGASDEAINEYVSDAKSATGRCNRLNKYISETLNLGSSYELGHSYFMNIKVHGENISQNAYENLFDLELAPLLTEYLRSEITDAKRLEDELKKMRNIFTQGEEIK